MAITFLTNDDKVNLENKIEKQAQKTVYFNAKCPPDGLTVAVGDGIADDSPALNELVTYINSIGGGVIFLPKGIYMLDAPISWMSNVSLIGENMGLSILKPRQAKGVGLGFAAIHNVSHTASNLMKNCTFKDFCIDGEEMNITSYSFRPKGIHLIFLSDCIFKDLIIRNVCASGLGIDHLSNVAIDNIGCYNCGRSWSGNGTEQNVGGAGLGIGTKNMNGEAIVIRNCVVDGCGNYGIFLEDQGSTPTNGESYIISNNIVKNGRNHGIVVKGGSRVIVANNVSFGNAKDGFAVLENNGFVSDIIKFTNNLSYENENGFRLESNGLCTDIFISDNVFSDNTNGIVINSAATDLEIMRNTVKDNTAGVVMKSVQHANCVFTDNIIFNNQTDYNVNATFIGDMSYNDIANTEPTGINFASSAYTIEQGKTLELNVQFSPSYASGEVVYTSNNTDAVTVDGNVATAVFVGQSTITAMCGSLTASCTIDVVEAVESINLWDSSIEMIPGFTTSDGVLDTTNNVDFLSYDGYIAVEPTKSYVFDITNDCASNVKSWRFIEYDGSKNYITRTLNLALGEVVQAGSTTAFVKIEVNVDESYALTIQENGVFEMYSLNNENLPSEYTQLNHIESGGSQYIDTGFVPNQDTKVIMKVRPVSGSGSQQRYFGVRSAQNTDAFDVTRQLGARYNGENYQGVGDSNGVSYEIVFDKNLFYVDDVLAHTFTYSAFSPNCNLFLCALNNNGSVLDVTKSYVKVYSCQIFDSDTLVRNFVPAMRNSDEVIGLYDTVTQTFFTDANGGNFS